MKVYVIKRNDGTYFDRCFDHYIRFADEVLFGEIFKLKGSAEEMIDFIIRNKYKFNISKEELSIEEYLLMSETELDDYTKQVRKEVCEEIRKKADIEFEKCRYENYITGEDTLMRRKLYRIDEEKLDQIQGEIK